MLRRVIPGVLISSIGFALAGCANETPITSSLTPVSVLSAQTERSPEAAGGLQPGQMPKKTLSDKVLTAIALERVTGMKPDPGRLTP